MTYGTQLDGVKCEPERSTWWPVFAMRQAFKQWIRASMPHCRAWALVVYPPPRRRQAERGLGPLPSFPGMGT
jgi:hypothetical protein